MTARPRYSIVVPTCDRAGLLKYTLSALTAIARADIEIVVSDNASTDETAAIIASFARDPRVVAVRALHRLAMPDHWDFAFGKASGDRIIVNGDDDGISPSLFETLDCVPQPLVSWYTALYHHPDYTVEGSPNTLHLKSGHSRFALTLDPKRMIERYADLKFDFFPEATRFCIARDLAQKIINKTGRLFWPAYPDFTAALLALCECKAGDYVYLDSTLGFGGRSQYSNAASFMAGTDAKRIKSFYSEFADDPFPFHEPKFPFYFNGHAQALTLAKHFYQLEGINLNIVNLYQSFSEEISGTKYNPLITETTIEEYKAHVETLDQKTRDLISRAPSVSGKQKLSGFRAPAAPQKQKAEGFRRFFVPVQFRYSLKAILRTLSRGRRDKMKISGFDNGYDLMTRWDKVMKERDHFTIANIESARNVGLLLSPPYNFQDRSLLVQAGIKSRESKISA